MAGDGDQKHLICRDQAYFYHPYSFYDVLQQPDCPHYSLDFVAFVKPSHNSVNLQFNSVV